MRAIDFEPTIHFPMDPTDAARVYLGALAYPERGAGQPGGLGISFGHALGQYVLWDRRRARGLRDLRALLKDPKFQPPRRRDFEGALNRGRRRLRRRVAAFDIVGNRTINGFINAWLQANRLASQGRSAEAFEVQQEGSYGRILPDITQRNTPSARKIVHRDIERWSDRFDLTTTGHPADEAQKGKDLLRRGYVQSEPVLHMAHGLNQVVADIAHPFDGWDKTDWLLCLIWNADAWVWTAIEMAERWRLSSQHLPAMNLTPDRMIHLVSPKAR